MCVVEIFTFNPGDVGVTFCLGDSCGNHFDSSATDSQRVNPLVCAPTGTVYSTISCMLQGINLNNVYRLHLQTYMQRRITTYVAVAVKSVNM